MADHWRRTGNIESSDKPTKKVSGSRKLMAVWVTILTAPLMLFAIFLFVVALMFFWDAFIGL